MADANNMFVAQMARVWLAPVGTAAPASPTSVMPVGWFDVGLFTPDSLSWSTDPSFEEIRSHQSKYPTRRLQTEDAAAISVDLQEWSSGNFKAVYGGGTVTKIAADTTAGTPEHYKFVPPKVGARTKTAACIELTDGPTKVLRRIIPLCEQNEGVEQNFNATAESTLPLRLAILGSDLGDPWYDLSTIPAMAPAA